MNSFTDAFKAMILREFFLEPRLAGEGYHNLATFP